MVTGLLTKACVRAELEHAELQISDENKESTSASSEITIWRIFALLLGLFVHELG